MEVTEVDKVTGCLIELSLSVDLISDAQTGAAGNLPVDKTERHAAGSLTVKPTAYLVGL